MNEVKIFSNQEFGSIRTVEIDGEVWFVGKDVAERLGYTDTAQAVRKHIDDEDKGVVDLTTPGGIQRATIINESGLYSLILSSKLPNAKVFKRWITSEVIPSIRKHGAYITMETAEQMLNNPDFMIRLLQELKSEQEKRRELEKQKQEDAPKVLFAEAVKTSDSTVTVGDLAKILKQNGIEIGRDRLFQWMRENGYLIKMEGTDFNVPTQKSMNAGLLELKESIVKLPNGKSLIGKTPKVTGKGQIYFVKKFLKEKDEK